MKVLFEANACISVPMSIFASSIKGSQCQLVYTNVFFLMA